MKKKVALIVCFMAINLLIVLPTLAGPVLDQIIASGKLRIGTTGTQPPMTVITKDNRIIGIDADIARGLAKSMNLEAEFVILPFAELLPALINRKVDLVLSGMTMTPTRNKEVAFVGPYYTSGKGILAIAEKYAALKETTGLNSPEVTIAAVKDSTSMEFTKSLMPKAKLIAPISLKESLNLLFAGTVDVVVADFPFCIWSLIANKEKKLFASKSPFSYEPLGIGLPEDILMINLVQNYMSRLKDEGRLEEIGKKWFNELSWVGEMQ